MKNGGQVKVKQVERPEKSYVRLRRDFGAVLALITGYSIFHQCSRKRDEAGRIIATHQDYAAIRELVVDIVSEGVDATVSVAVQCVIPMSDSFRKTLEVHRSRRSTFTRMPFRHRKGGQ
jgi:hypothetical protein